MATPTGKAMNKKEEINPRQVQQWLIQAGKFALAQQNSLNTSLKTDDTLVTNVDHHIEALLFEHIFQTYPGHQILSEEGSNHRHEGEFPWVIDPIDGTRAYISGLPVWGISVGILKQGKPYAGFFHMPATGEMYWGTNDKGFFNNQPMLPRDNVSLEDRLAFIAIPSNAHSHYKISFGRLRSLGSTTAHLAYVARGVATAALTRNLYLWDIAAVLPLFNATGISLVYLSGREFNAEELLDGRRSPEPLIAAPTGIIEEVRALIQMK